MKVLIFSPEKPYTGAESIVTGRLMHAMLQRGWETNLIFHETDLIYSSDRDALSILDRCRGIENKLIKYLSKKITNKPLLKAIASLDSLLWAIKACLLAFRLNNAQNYDLILSRVMPQYGHLPALIFKLRNREIPWIANWSDPLPHIKAPEPYGQGLDAKAGAFSLFYLNQVIRFADWHTFPSKRLMIYFQTYLPLLKSSSSVLPHVLNNPDVIRHSEASNDDTLLLAHVGSLGIRDPSNLILAFKHLKNTGELKTRLKFRFVGPIDKYVHELIDRNSLLDDFSLEGLKSYEDTLEVIKCSDIMLVVEAALKEGIFLPSKVLDYLQNNKPILAISPAIGVMNDLISSFGGGITADCTSVNDIAIILKKISAEEALIRNGDGPYNTQNLKSQFSNDYVFNELERIYGDLKKQ